jgi:asparagine synthase (glutamine-hydrolysing)
MCGISGWFLKQGISRDDAHLVAMADAIEHRGPDDRGYFYDRGRGVAFAHNRLSIIDLSPAGHQPMTSQVGRFVLNFGNAQGATVNRAMKPVLQLLAGSTEGQQ